MTDCNTVTTGRTAVTRSHNFFWKISADQPLMRPVPGSVRVDSGPLSAWRMRIVEQMLTASVYRLLYGPFAARGREVRARSRRNTYTPEATMIRAPTMVNTSGVVPQTR